MAAPAACGGLRDIEHVVIFIQENRSFDHYFGSYPGVRGFDDHGAGDLGPFAQPFSGNGTRSAGRLLPFHLDTSSSNAACVNDITHEWGPQHRSWNHGRMDQFVAAHTDPANDGPDLGTMTMGYYTRQDLAYYYALADAFTICDNYHCSIFGPTYPNRLYSMTGTIDPDGKAGGPVVTNPSAGLGDFSGLYSWTTMPERLQAAGISWKVYNQAGTNNNMLPLFKQYTGNPASPLFQNAFLPTFPATFELDCATGNLPQVSWVLTPMNNDEHPPSPSERGAYWTSVVLNALTGNPAIWSKTVMFLTYDENGGFFDHLPPPVPEDPNQPGEYLGVNPLPPEAAGIRGPIGLGFRVPALVISPFSRGGFVNSDVFDHTSLLRFLETRFGVEVPNLSAWRRATTGDLTSTIGLNPDTNVPTLPAPALVDATVAQECAVAEADGTVGNAPPYALPATQSMPSQERGSRRRLAAAACASGQVRGTSSAPGDVALPTTGTGAEGFGALRLTTVVAAGVAAGALRALARRRSPGSGQAT